MGNNPSKPEGKTTPPSVTTSHSSTTTHSRKEPRASAHITKTSNPQPTASNASGHRVQQQQQQQQQLPQQHEQHHYRSHSPSAAQPYPSPHSYSHSYSKPAGSSTQPSPPRGRMGNDQSKWRSKKEPSNPVTVPQRATSLRHKGPNSQLEPSAPPRDDHYIPHSNLNFPPRLPLPIEEEIHTPGSPIFRPAGISSALNDEDIEESIPRQSSVVSSTTIDDDDDIGDELQPFSLNDTRRTVATVVQWKQSGDKVYVTGTFTSWSRKFRMTRDPDTGFLSTVLQLPPGTHHVKFIVDGDMQLSKELPTAVDFTNILVNYIEVSADDLPRTPPPKNRIPEGLFPPQVIPEGIEVTDHEPHSVGKAQPGEDGQASKPVFWGNEVPKYLDDLDQPEHSKKYQRAARGVAEFATPPSLPLFLGKSILNGTTPMKDDSSVLNMPNHTVLNHLATSSIKNQVLATSVTTRYKRKYVTTIMYKPTVGDND